MYKHICNQLQKNYERVWFLKCGYLLNSTLTLSKYGQLYLMFKKKFFFFTKGTYIYLLFQLHEFILYNIVCIIYYTQQNITEK